MLGDTEQWRNPGKGASSGKGNVPEDRNHPSGKEKEKNKETSDKSGGTIKETAQDVTSLPQNKNNSEKNSDRSSATQEKEIGKEEEKNEGKDKKSP